MISRLVPETVYGSQKRLRWIVSHLRRDDRVVEFGCGTGSMITLPLARLGFRVVGLDSDQASVEYGRGLLESQGLDPGTLRCAGLEDLGQPDVIVASEVLEHLPGRVLDDCLAAMRRRIAPDGTLLVTVPNGYGWFELESLAWRRLGVERLLEWARHAPVVVRLKRRLLGRDPAPCPSTLSHSPHVQRFTLRSICTRLEAHGFHVRDTEGSVLVCGPFSNLLLTRLGPLMRLNTWLGTRLRWAAAGFFVRATAHPR